MPDTPLNPDALSDTARVALINSARELGQEHWCLSVPAQAKKVLNDCADALAAAQPEVNSVEELDKLPMHSYVQGNDGFKHAKDWAGGWHLIVNRPSSAPHLSGSIELPARVLYRPTKESTNGR